MAFQQGTVNGQIAFLQALETFATANGWTLEYGGVARDNSSDRQTMLSHVRNSVTRYYSFASRVTATPDRLHYTPHNGINTANSIYAQPSSASSSSYQGCIVSIPKTGAFEYFLFGNQQYIAMVFRMGVYHQHAFIGQIDLAGGYTVGSLAVSSQANSSVAYQYDNTSMQSAFVGYGGLASAPALNCLQSYFCRYDGSFVCGSHAGATGTFMFSGDSHFSTSSFGPTLASAFNYPKYVAQNAAPALIPIGVFPRHPSISNKSHYAGAVPGVFYVNMLEHYSGKEITIGSDTYMIFPHWWVGGASGNFHPQTGYAFKKVI